MHDDSSKPYQLELGPVSLELRTKDALLRAALEERYGSFFSPAPCEHNKARYCITLNRKPFSTLGDPYDTRVVIERHAVRLESSVLFGQLDLDRRIGTLAVHVHPRFGAGVYLENALRQIVQVVAVEHHAFLLHAAAIAHPTRDEVHVFSGKSGSGKTTISELLRRRNGRILSDDLVMVDCRSSRPQLIATPFFGTLREAVPIAGLTGQISALNFLRQSSRASVTPVTNNATSLAMTMTNVPFAEPFDRAHRGLLLETVAHLVESVPARQLAFRKDLSFLSHIGWSDMANPREPFSGRKPHTPMHRSVNPSKTDHTQN